MSSERMWNMSPASIPKNDWVHVEVYLRMNSIGDGKGVADGIMQTWINGTQVLDKSNILYRTAQDATKKWSQFILAPYIGDGAPIAQTMWMDELTVGTASPYSSSDTLAPTAPSGLSVS